MSDKTEWKGCRLGDYLLGKRYLGIPEEEGQLYEAHHVETGEPALVLLPGRDDDWRTSSPWRLLLTSLSGQKALVLHPQRADGAAFPSFHELALGSIRIAGTLTRIDEREDIRAHFERGPRRSRRHTRRWGIAGAGAVLAVGLALLLWPRLSIHSQLRALPDDPPVFMTGQKLESPGLTYPMPEKPFKQQRKPPCLPETEVELRGGCWMPHRSDAPCPPGTAEYQGRCYVAVKEPEPEPRSSKP